MRQVSQSCRLYQVGSLWQKGTEILFFKKARLQGIFFKDVTDFINEYVIMCEKFSEIYSAGTPSIRTCRALRIILTKLWLQVLLVHCGI